MKKTFFFIFIIITTTLISCGLISQESAGTFNDELISYQIKLENELDKKLQIIISNDADKATINEAQSDLLNFFEEIKTNANNIDDYNHESCINFKKAFITYVDNYTNIVNEKFPELADRAELIKNTEDINYMKEFDLIVDEFIDKADINIKGFVKAQDDFAEIHNLILEESEEDLEIEDSEEDEE